MKESVIFTRRNKAIEERFRELKAQGRNNAQCFDIMVWEFYLAPTTIADIVWGRYRRRKEKGLQAQGNSNQINLFC